MGKQRKGTRTSSPPPLATEILQVMVSSFAPTRRRPAVRLEYDREALKGKPSVVERLLRENPWEKVALAKLYTERVILGSRSAAKSSRAGVSWSTVWQGSAAPKPAPIFIESGSTCAYVSELVRRLAARGNSNIREFPLSTNNHLTAWLFLNRDLYLDPPADKESSTFLVPSLVAGRLESKYHGIFPFYDRRHHERAERDRSEFLQEERNGYAQLRLTLAGSDLLLLAASRLSLRYGPLVGSRENAIFKNACYNACVPPIDQPASKEIHLFVTVQKLVAHSAANRRLKTSDERFSDFHTWEEENQKINDKECFAAFSFMLIEKAQPSVDVRSPFSADLMPSNAQRLVDGTSAVEMGEGRFRVCESWQDLFTKAKLTVKVFLAYPGGPLRSNPYAKWIRGEVEDARKTTADIDFTYKLSGPLSPSGSSQSYSLATVCISPASTSVRQ